MGLERCLACELPVAASYAQLTRRGHPQCKMEHTPIDVSEYLLGREKFCKDIQTAWLCYRSQEPSCWKSKPDLGSKGDTQVIVSAVVEINFVAEFEAETDGS